LVLAGTLARTGNVILPGWVMDTTCWPKKMAAFSQNTRRVQGIQARNRPPQP